MRALRVVGIALLATLSLSAASFAQNTAAINPSQMTTLTPAGVAPESVTALIDVCGPVIDAQYKNSDARRGECVNPTGLFLDAMKAKTAPADMGNVVADTVAELVKLYRPTPDCKKHETELPQAIALALSYTTDPVQIDAIKGIAAAIAACQNIQTGAIGPIPQLSPA